MDFYDYDGRTALHIAAAEGHFEIVKFLLELGKVKPEPQDRWGCTPYQEAKRFGHKTVYDYINTFLFFHTKKDISGCVLRHGCTKENSQ